MHMGLAFDTIPWRSTDKDAIAFSGQGRVPVLIDGDQIAFDSWTIANYLEDTYPDRPSLFGGEGGRAVTRFVSAWADVILVGGILRLIATDILTHLHEEDCVYFRKTREKRLGATLGTLTAHRETCARVPEDLGAHSHPTSSTALRRWWGASLCRLCRVRMLPMGAMHKLFSTAAQGRSGLGVA